MSHDHVQHGLTSVDEVDSDSTEGEENTLPRLDGSTVVLPPLRIPPNEPCFSKSRVSRSSSKTSGLSSSSTHSKPHDVLHMSAVCDHDTDGNSDNFNMVKNTKSAEELTPIPHLNLGATSGKKATRTSFFKSNIIIDRDEYGRKSVCVSKTKRVPAVDRGAKTLEPLSEDSSTVEPYMFSSGGRRPSFAGYHKCRKRSVSLPQALAGTTHMTTPIRSVSVSKSAKSVHNIRRTNSGLGLIGSIVAEEELRKGKLLSLFEAQLSSSKIKTFYNGVVGVLEDRQRQDRIIHEEKTFIIHPLSTFRLVWDSLLLLAIMLMMTILPMKLAFFKIFDANDIKTERITWYPLILFIDTIFMTDVILSFFTGIIEQNQNPPKINLDRKEIQRRYLRSWFIPDLLSSIPFDVFGSEIAGDAKNDIILAAGASKIFMAAKILKMFSLIRILRMGRINMILKQWANIFEISPLMIKILQLLTMFFMIAHWSACIQFFVIYLRGYPKKSWPVILGIQDASWTDQYIWAIFRSLSHMITIGYGRDPPEETIEVLLVIPSMLIGAFFYMMIVSQMTRTISMFKIGDIRYTEKLYDVDDFVKKYDVSSEIHQRMHEFFHHKYGGKLHDENDIIQELPLALKIDVIKAKYKEMLDNVFFMKTGCEGLIEQFILSTDSSVYMTGDIIVRSEDVIENLYVIMKGTVSIEFTAAECTLQDEIIVRTYGFFGETPMLLRQKADMMVYAETPCDFLMIPKFIFFALCEQYPLFKNQMLLVAHSRILLQGIDPDVYAPALKQDFADAASDSLAVRSSEDILELASQSRLDAARMEEFRCKNTVNYSVFRKLQTRKKGEMPPSQHTPIDPFHKSLQVQHDSVKSDKDQAIHVSLSFHADDNEVVATVQEEEFLETDNHKDKRKPSAKFAV